ncbi:Secreted effector protein pipB2 [Bremerella volcania]|uniref:Secreted effector protein pipB2 n=1 Tax=Bremerella volcania TaxID=2527984 RepID=A0A518CCB7_9BACT|nr:pentapeptide repeat-containing protein [Bremerella volcania]QDU76861.1 Secreted effector protein pipB2 [Bremerella volcania]
MPRSPKGERRALCCSLVPSGEGLESGLSFGAPPFLFGDHMTAITNLEGEILHEYDGESLSNSFLGNKYLRGAQLAEADLSGADLRDAKLMDADLSGADLTGAKLDGVDLSRANLAAAKFDGTSLANVIFTEANLQNTSFRSCELDGCQFQSADATESNFSETKLTNCNFESAKAERSCFENATMSWAGMAADGATFSNANFNSAQFHGVSLKHADLSGATFVDADILGPVVTLANLRDVDFSQVRRLENMFVTSLRSDDSKGYTWPPSEFGFDEAPGPHFDNQTYWPPDIRFPRRRFTWKVPLLLGFIPGIILAQLGSWTLPEEVGGVLFGWRLEIGLACAALAAAWEAGQMVRTNSLITSQPDIYFSGAGSKRRSFFSE